MSIVPIIHKIYEKESLFYCMDSDDEVILITNSQDVANIYYAVPSILEQQAQIIQDITKKYNDLSNEYDAIVFNTFPSGSRFMH